MHRKEYWNNKYVQYWKKRVEEGNKNKESSSIVKGDTIAGSDEAYINALNFLALQKDMAVLEIGCGFGRTLPMLYEITKNITAIDISENMIEEAKKKYSNLENIKYHVCEAEKTPLRSNTFSYVICYAVFDALYQHLALLEINRLLEIGGQAIVSGKNDNYHNDDNLAYTAEINAREKGHPNYFTNISLLLSGTIQEFGFEIKKIRFFRRRGDTAKNQYTIEQPNYFYEYIMVLNKIREVNNVNLKISDMYSKTYYRKKERANENK